MKKTLFWILSAAVLMFVGLKLAGKILWSWWWVFSPWWIPAAAYVLLVVVNLCYMTYQYRHNEKFRKAMDDYRRLRSQSTTTLAERLEEMKQQAMKMQRKEGRP